MPSFLAKTESWIQSKVGSEKVIDPKADVGFVVEALDCILDFRDVKETISKQVRASLSPATSALACLCHWPFRTEQPPEALLRQPSLGRMFTSLTLDHVHGKGTFANSAWKLRGRLQNSRSFRGVVVGRDPAAKNLVAWCAGVLKVGTQPAEDHTASEPRSCRCRIHGRADLDVSQKDDEAVEKLVPPVFVDHERGPHCERQALLAQIRRMLSKNAGLHDVTSCLVVRQAALRLLGMHGARHGHTKAGSY